MGIIVKLLGSGLGLASEAIHDYRARSRSQPRRAPSPNPATNTASSSRNAPAPALDAPPEYAEVADEATAEQLVRSGKAERVVDYADEKKGRTSKAAEAAYPKDHTSSRDDDSNIVEVNDEAAWELDEMAERVAPPSYTESEAGVAGVATGEGESEEDTVKKEEQMIRDILRMAGPPPHPVGRIPCPVIIPQRRPRNKDRGFVKAYAPVLEECGVSQDVFLKFLKDWLAASKSDPWIDIVFVAAGIVGFAPEMAAQIVSTVVQVVAGTARELQSRHRRNTFLDRVNQELFMPRGLYAMVMAFKEEVPGQQPGGPLSRLAGTLGQSLFSSERLDINQTVSKYSKADSDMSRLKKGLKDIRLTSGKTYGEIELPEAAPLIYPDLDRAVRSDLEQNGKGKGPDNEGIKEKWKGAGKWVQEYMDRKAQASYEMDHEGSSLAVPSSSRKTFSSRFSDPNHPVNSGSLVALLTGGVVNPAARQPDWRAAKQERKAGRREDKDERRGIIRKIMQQDVLYLLIVSLPTEQEVQQSIAELERVMTENAPRA